MLRMVVAGLNFGGARRLPIGKRDFHAAVFLVLQRHVGAVVAIKPIAGICAGIHQRRRIGDGDLDAAGGGDADLVWDS